VKESIDALPNALRARSQPHGDNPFLRESRLLPVDDDSDGSVVLGLRPQSSFDMYMASETGYSDAA
jgi:hypothetical protein